MNLANSEKNMLEKFFNQEGMKKGVEKSTLVTNSGDPQMQNPIAEFSLVSSSINNFAPDFVLGEITSTKMMPKARDDAGELETPQKEWVNENWISFIGYSFEDGLKNKILFVPIINLIHAFDPAPKTPTPVQS